MNLYLLRHADAIDQAETDVARYLTPKGIAQAKSVGRFCRDQAIVPDVILSSPYRRAEETAEIVAGKIGSSQLLVAPFLGSGMQPSVALDELEDYKRLAGVMLVGHEPDFSLLAATLLGLSEARRLHLRKASLTHLESESLAANSAVLHFILPVKFLGCK